MGIYPKNEKVIIACHKRIIISCHMQEDLTKRNMCKGAIAVLNDPVYKTRDIRTMLREIPQ